MMDHAGTTLLPKPTRADKRGEAEEAARHRGKRPNRVLAKGSDLARALNNAKGAEKRRLVDLVPRFQQLPLVPLWIDCQPDERSARFMQEFNKRLARYRLGGYRLRLSNNDPDENGPPCEIALVSDDPGEQRGVYAVEWLVWLAEQGALNRLHLCPVCHKWFFGRPDAECCNYKCSGKKQQRQHWLNQAPGEQAAYMRFYRKARPLYDLINQLTEKREDGFHLVKAERQALAGLQEQLAKLERKYNKKYKPRKISDAKN